MKKRIVLFGILLLMSGCGGTKLACTKEDETTMTIISQAYELTYQEDKFANVVYQYRYYGKMAETATIDQLYELTVKKYEPYRDQKKTTIKIEQEKLTVTVTIKTKPSDNKKLLQNIGIPYETYQTYDQAKTQLESLGYLCE